MAKAETPLMQQFYKIKEKHPEAILLFRVGDFYETFEKDAILTSKILNITLTKRANGSASFVELAGFPYHALDSYLPKLVRAGQRVAICEQLEDPKLTKSIVKRGVTELITPGTSLNDSVLEKNENSFLASIFIDKQIFGISLLDISTGDFFLSQGDKAYINMLIQNFHPKEIIFENTKKKLFQDTFNEFNVIFGMDDWVFTEENATNKLLSLFKVKSLKGFGIENLSAGIIAAGAIIDYLDYTHHIQKDHIKHISRIDENQYVWIDKFSSRNLEIFASPYEGGKGLIDIIDKTISPMGGRMLRRWLALPLKNINSINERLSAVEVFVANDTLSENLNREINKISDLERLASKISFLKINPREVVVLNNSLKTISPIIEICKNSECENLLLLSSHLKPLENLIAKIDKEINPECPALLNKGNVIANNVSQELDDLRNLIQNSKSLLEDFETNERQRTGISSLKLGFNSIFGYFFEVRRLYKHLVPTTWTIKQTLVDRERYINIELKEFEDKILGAEEKISNLENTIYNELITYILGYISDIQTNANIIANIDCLLSFAKSAKENNYCKPILDDSNTIDIKDGRHPVIEKQLPYGDEYIPNDVFLDDKSQQIMMITGPNMSGKSALLRQTALICLLAQIGSFVPAKSANLGIVDKIFTRIGASDNISMGESTFMVEMIETSNILNNISHKSLILLDELGRGTSTYDGISIAWAVAEYIHEHSSVKAKTLFATHYHELNEMEKSFPRIKNFHVSVKEANDKVIFLRKLISGGSEHSFGIHVAQMAGMPKSVVFRSKQILEQLENNANSVESSSSEKYEKFGKKVDTIAQTREGYQLSLFQLDDPVLSEIHKRLKKIDINNITPLEALNLLDSIKRMVGANR
ncbi:MAG: DNA mismatch repair protein MutS [Bacteroidales bacterium]|jgi:DNA mismatch repair protein MutS|nr:DNA mismatch repair protein MutS [Bacteroidales bacterium]